MAPPAFRPENALKKADDLISIGNSQAALQSLYDFMTSRRIRFAQPSTIEPIVFKFVELGVDLKKGKMIKDGLHQYKKLVQNSPEGLTSVGTVARKFVDVVEIKMAKEQAKEDQKEEEEDEDLEGGVTPENLLNSVYESDQSVGGFNDEEITSWTRFTWESYRSILDLLRNNSHLEITYAGVVNRTMNFCLVHNRKNEFKRLADMLRQHLDAANYQQSKHGSNIVDLSDATTLQRYLDQRFQLVNISVKLELWHEAFRAVEDVYHLMKMSKRTPKSSTLALYYKNLAKIFFVSNDQLLHTISWNKFYELFSTNPNATEEQFKDYANRIFLSGLAIKLDTLPTVGYDPQARLYRYLNLESKPTRKDMISKFVESELYEKVDENIKELYKLIETNFSIENVHKELPALLTKLSANKFFSQYSEQIRDVIVRKIYVEASTQKQTADIDELFKVATLPEPMNLTYWDLEKALLQAAVEDYVSFTIDHESNKVHFVSDPFETFIQAPVAATEEAEEAEGEEEENKEDDAAAIDEESKAAAEGEEEAETEIEPEVIVTRNSYIRNKLSQLSQALHEVDNFNEISYMEKIKLARENLIEQTKAAIERTKEAAEERAKRHQEQKQKYLEENALNAEQSAEERQQRILEEKAAMEAKMAEETHRRLLEKKKRELEALKKAETLKVINEANAKGHVYIDPKEADTLDLSEIRNKIISMVSKDQSELEERMDSALKRIDYTERALRKVELPALQKEADSMKEADKAKFDAMKDKIIEAAKAEHESKLEDHKRLTAVYGDFSKLKERLASENEAKISEIRRAKIEEFEAAKQARITEIRQQRYEEAVAKRRQEKLEEARIKRLQQQEEVARKQREVEEALERKSATASRIPAAAPVVQKSRADLDEVARKQREVEEALERKANAEKAAPSRAPVRTTPIVQKSKADLDEIARKQREVEEALERKLSGKTVNATPSPAPTSSSSAVDGAKKPLSFAEKMRLRRQQK